MLSLYIKESTQRERKAREQQVMTVLTGPYVDCQQFLSEKSGGRALRVLRSTEQDKEGILTVGARKYHFQHSVQAATR